MYRTYYVLKTPLFSVVLVPLTSLSLRVRLTCYTLRRAACRFLLDITRIQEIANRGFDERCCSGTFSYLLEARVGRSVLLVSSSEKRLGLRTV